MIDASRLEEKVSWDDKGLVPAIAQDWQTGEVLMLAWMNAESLRLTVEEDRAIYWSRSRGRLWRKGEESGNVQHLKELCIDCDGDTILLKVEQVGGIACHTGRRHCFFQTLEADDWVITSDPVKSPEEIYGRGDE